MTLDVNADYMSSPQVAKALRITPVGVAQLARQGKIPAVKIANRWLVPRDFVDQFARTYQGRRGRPRKSRRPAPGLPAAQAPQSPLAELTAAPDTIFTRHETSGILTINAWIADLEEAPVVFTPDAGISPVKLTGTGDFSVAVEPVPSIHAQAVPEEVVQAPAPEPSESSAPEAVAASGAAVLYEPKSGEVPDADTPPSISQERVADTPAETAAGAGGARAPVEAEGTGYPGNETFSVSAEVYHLDKNYDFEVYEKGQMTEWARLIVARLKPKIPSLPQFSFRWDYRYEHLNVDIQGVDPAVADWWKMGENGYTGHLPRRLGGPGYAFEAIIWLPVTFVFRGRLTLSLQRGMEGEDDSTSVATTTGGLRRLWTKWSKLTSK